MHARRQNSERLSDIESPFMRYDISRLDGSGLNNKLELSAQAVVPSS